jgi:hypothetical protein
MKDELIDKSLDDKLQVLIENNSLKWLPWIGKNYVSSENKILIIGESHYGKSNEALEDHKNHLFTREAVADMSVNGKSYGVKFYSNMHKCLIGNDSFDPEKLWSNIAFYNFIQRTMVGNKARPNKDDYAIGWEAFYSIIEILKPDVCIFLGVSSISRFKNDTSFKFESLNYRHFPKTDSVIPRYVEIKSYNKIIKVYSIKHPGSRISWSQWHQFLQDEEPNEINWLKSKVVHTVFSEADWRLCVTATTFR